MRTIVLAREGIPAPTMTRHQRISLSLLHLIQSYLDTHPIGELFSAPFDVVLSFHDGGRSRFDLSFQQECWLVDPDRDIVTIYRRAASGFLPPLQFEKDVVVTTPLLPGFDLSLARVLA
jgi:hypothetical protein